MNNSKEAKEAARLFALALSRRPEDFWPTSDLGSRGCQNLRQLVSNSFN